MAEGRITAFAVSPAEAGDPRFHDLCLTVGYYIDSALCESRGGYEGHELPPLAEHFYDLWTYYGEWSNGGHAQYHANIPDPSSWARASELLGRLGLPEYKQLLDDMMAFVSSKAELIEDLYRTGREREADAMFRPFDDQFCEIERKCGALNRHLHGWLLQQPWVKIDAARPPLSSETLALLLPPHPRRAQRQTANIRRRKAAMRGGVGAFLRRLIGI